MRKENKKVVIKKVIKVNDEENNNKIIQLLDLNLLDKKANGNWDDWAEVGMAIKSSNPNGIDNFIRFSKINKDKYDKNETVQFWEGIKIKDENENKLCMGSLMMWAKNCDKDIYNMTFNPFLKKSDIEKGALCVAKVISNDLTNHLNYCNKICFIVLIKNHVYGSRLSNHVK